MQSHAASAASIHARNGWSVGRMGWCTMSFCYIVCMHVRTLASPLLLVCCVVVLYAPVPVPVSVPFLAQCFLICSPLHVIVTVCPCKLQPQHMLSIFVIQHVYSTDPGHNINTIHININIS